MRIKCECGWSIAANEPATVKCGRCGETQRIGSPFPLGDHLERLLSYVGGRQFKQWYKRLAGKDCGCDARQRWMNRAGGRIYATMQMWRNR